MTINRTTNINPDVFSVICSFLTPQELAICAQVNKEWKKLAESPYIQGIIATNDRVPYTHLFSYARTHGLALQNENTLYRLFQKFTEQVPTNQTARFICYFPLQKAIIEIKLQHDHIVNPIAAMMEPDIHRQENWDIEKTLIVQISGISQNHPASSTRTKATSPAVTILPSLFRKYLQRFRKTAPPQTTFQSSVEAPQAAFFEILQIRNRLHTSGLGILQGLNRKQDLKKAFLALAFVLSLTGIIQALLPKVAETLF